MNSGPTTKETVDFLVERFADPQQRDAARLAISLPVDGKGNRIRADCFLDMNQTKNSTVVVTRKFKGNPPVFSTLAEGNLLALITDRQSTILGHVPGELHALLLQSALKAFDQG